MRAVGHRAFPCPFSSLFGTPVRLWRRDIELGRGLAWIPFLCSAYEIPTAKTGKRGFVPRFRKSLSALSIFSDEMLRGVAGRSKRKPFCLVSVFGRVPAEDCAGAAERKGENIR